MGRTSTVLKRRGCGSPVKEKKTKLLIRGTGILESRKGESVAGQKEEASSTHLHKLKNFSRKASSD